MRFHSRHHSSSECHPEVLTPGGRIFQAWLTSIRAKCATATNQLMSVTKRNARTETCSDTPIDAMHYQNLNFRRYLKTINACHGSGLLLPRSFCARLTPFFFGNEQSIFRPGTIPRLWSFSQSALRYLLPNPRGRDAVRSSPWAFS